MSMYSAREQPVSVRPKEGVLICGYGGYTSEEAAMYVARKKACIDKLYWNRASRLPEDPFVLHECNVAEVFKPGTAEELYFFGVHRAIPSNSCTAFGFAVAMSKTKCKSIELLDYSGDLDKIMDRMHKTLDGSMSGQDDVRVYTRGVVSNVKYPYFGVCIGLLMIGENLDVPVTDPDKCERPYFW